MPRVLVVDDEPVIQHLLEETLAGDGAEVVLAGGVEDALERLGAETFDVALIDLLLPKPTGWGLLEALRSHPEWPKAVVVSAKATPANLTRAFDLGAVDVVSKPFDPVELSALVTRIAGLGPAGVEAHRRSARARVHA